MKQVAWALINKASTFGKLGRSENAITVYDDIIAKFGQNKIPELARLIDEAKKDKVALLKKKINPLVRELR